MQLDTDDAALERFSGVDGKALDDEAGRNALSACCASRVWVARIWAGRPYRSRAELLDAAEAACRDLDEAELDRALAGHPRIGDRAAGSGVEARWSRQEQATVSDADAGTRDELAEANRGSAAEMLSELRRRLGNDPATERREVADQLAQITRLRVERLLDS
jgi:2-oxo-4-hydroxy-4-carboxy-5-ureidoimidazoline decarboxylase